MSLPNYEHAMMGFTTDGLPPVEAKKKRIPKWDWELGASLIGPYLDGNQLAACCLVSKEFHKCFLPLLWSKPFTILKSKQRPSFKLYQFMYLAHSARVELRSLVQTLDFGQIHNFKAKKRADTLLEKHIFHGVFHGAWFMHCVNLFPRLRFVMMDVLPSLSYTVTDTLEQADPLEIFGPPNLDNSINNASDATENQSLSGAASSSNDFPSSLHHGTTKTSPILFCFNGVGRVGLLKEIVTTNLLYLDLSYSKKDTTAYPGTILDFENLRVLKLRGCRLVDSEAVRWSPRGSKVWCLDVRDNSLTDKMVDHLLSHCILDQIPPPKETGEELSDQHMYEDVPEYQRDDGQLLGTIVQRRPHEKKDFMNYIERHSSFPTMNDQILDESDPLLRRTGLTHLFISGNKLTSRGVKFFLTKTNRIQHLDAGSVEATNSRKFYEPYTNALAQVNSRSTVGLLRESGTRMEALRIHHSIVTFTPTLINVGSRNQGFSLPLVKRAEWEAGLLRLAAISKEPSQYPFSPLHNYRITELTLTDLPSKSYGFTIDRLNDLLNDCAIQEAALNAARRSQPNRRAPQLLKGLRTLCLEFIPEDTAAQSPSGGSVSGDRDADNFLASSEGDFSFFGQDTMSSVSRRGSVATSGSETAVPSTPASRKGSLAGSVALHRAMSGLSSRPSSSGPGAAPPRYNDVLDVVQELKRWRAKNPGRWTGNIELKYRDDPRMVRQY